MRASVYVGRFGVLPLPRWLLENSLDIELLEISLVKHFLTLTVLPSKLRHTMTGRVKDKYYVHYFTTLPVKIIFIDRRPSLTGIHHFGIIEASL